MNFLATVSPTKPTVSGSRTSPTSIDDVVPEEAPTVAESRKSTLNRSGPSKARSRRRSSQTRTTYQLAQPPPSARQRQRFRLRPKTLLQLQQVINTSRPIPIFDVLPSINFAPRLPWRVPRILQDRQGLGLDDLVFVQSQPRTSPSSHFEQLPWNVVQGERTDREIVAAICQSSPTARNGQGRTEIRFSHGPTWKATSLQSGAYEFVSQGQGGSQPIARWMPKRDDSKLEGAGSSELLELATPKFRFSLIDVKSRRHPVIANMSKQSIEVYDRYSVPHSPQVTPGQDHTGLFEQVGSEDRVEIDDGECNEPCRTVIETDDDLRTLIAITGVWVAFCEQWFPSFRYSTKQVISNGISELSNRRRMNDGQPLALKADDRSQQGSKMADGIRHKSGDMHEPVPSSIPHSPLADLPAASPRRTASTSTTVFGDDENHYGASFESERRMSPMSLNHLEVVKPRMSSIASIVEKPAWRARSELLRSTSAQRPEEKSNNAVVVAEGASKRPGTFRRVVARLRQTRSDPILLNLSSQSKGFRACERPRNSLCQMTSR